MLRVAKGSKIRLFTSDGGKRAALHHFLLQRFCSIGCPQLPAPDTITRKAIHVTSDAEAGQHKRQQEPSPGQRFSAHSVLFVPESTFLNIEQSLIQMDFLRLQEVKQRRFLLNMSPFIIPLHLNAIKEIVT